MNSWTIISSCRISQKKGFIQKLPHWEELDKQRIAGMSSADMRKLMDKNFPMDRVIDIGAFLPEQKFEEGKGCTAVLYFNKMTAFHPLRRMTPFEPVNSKDPNCQYQQ